MDLMEFNQGLREQISYPWRYGKSLKMPLFKILVIEATSLYHVIFGLTCMHAFKAISSTLLGLH